MAYRDRSPIFMAGEQWVDGLLRRYEAFYYRLNFEAPQRMVVYKPNGLPVRSGAFFLWSVMFPVT
jgi:hypothetical protein